jgi:hypothetical protein
VFCVVDHYTAEAWAHVAKTGDRFAALQPVYDAVIARFGGLGADVVRMAHRRRAADIAFDQPAQDRTGAWVAGVAGIGGIPGSWILRPSSRSRRTVVRSVSSSLAGSFWSSGNRKSKFCNGAGRPSPLDAHTASATARGPTWTPAAPNACEVCSG